MARQRISAAPAPSAFLVLCAAILLASPARAIPLDALDPGRDWKLGALRFHGNDVVSTRTLRSVLATTPRSRFTPWRQLPLFDPVAFRTDLERLRRAYESRGYYHARVTADITVPPSGDALAVDVTVEEGPPIHVVEVAVEFSGDPLPDAVRVQLLHTLPIATGKVFDETSYEDGRAALATAYRRRSYARVDATKRARIDLEQNEVRVAYRVVSGPPCVFGEARITGALVVGNEVVRRELAFKPGDVYDPARVDTTRQNLVALNLFRVVHVEEDRSHEAHVNVYVRLEEAPPRDVRLGIGYDTEEQARGLASWRDYNFLGGARQLGFTGRVSLIRRTLAADFLQPHFPAHDFRTRFLVSEERLDEDPFTLDRTRGSPRLEWQATPRVTTYGFYRIEYESLSAVPEPVRQALPDGVPENGILSGAGLGVEWNATDDLLDPTRGVLLTSVVEPVGLGGDFSFVRVVGEGRLYQPVVGRLGAFLRVRLGTAEPFGPTREVPIFERFFAGGINSVRGYGRWDVGPRASDNNPIGGQSVIETSIELNHPITKTLGAAVFFDAGQASRPTLTFPLQDLERGVGAGLRYKTPVGPLRLDLAVPLDRRRGDNSFQVHVSVGPAF